MRLAKQIALLPVIVAGLLLYGLIVVLGWAFGGDDEPDTI